MHRRHGCNDQHAEFNAMCVVVAVEQCRYILPTTPPTILLSDKLHAYLAMHLTPRSPPL
jgi:hypothetical protein